MAVTQDYLQAQDYELKVGQGSSKILCRSTSRGLEIIKARRIYRMPRFNILAKLMLAD